MYGSCYLLRLRSESRLQEEYDSWDAIADYVFRVIRVPVSLSHHSILSLEELQRYISIDAPSRPGGASRGR